MCRDAKRGIIIAEDLEVKMERSEDENTVK
jgi:hypothetical protein